MVPAFPFFLAAQVHFFADQPSLLAENRCPDGSRWRFLLGHKSSSLTGCTMSVFPIAEFFILPNFTTQDL